jgi:hypothetical protein
VLLFTVFHSLGQTQSLIGHWRRFNYGKKEISSNVKQQFGDLILVNDSNFTMVGDEAAQKQKIPGWNAGETSSRR